jgi:hypothetical protein
MGNKIASSFVKLNIEHLHEKNVADLVEIALQEAQ